jgi:hypothetical protein
VGVGRRMDSGWAVANGERRAESLTGRVCMKCEGTEEGEESNEQSTKGGTRGQVTILSRYVERRT